MKEPSGGEKTSADPGYGLILIPSALLVLLVSLIYFSVILHDRNSISVIDAEAFKPLPSPAGAEIKGERNTAPVDLNSAGMEELQELPGISQKTALDIIEYRNTHGFFRNPEEIKNVKGIKEKKFGKIKDRIITR